MVGLIAVVAVACSGPETDVAPSPEVPTTVATGVPTAQPDSPTPTGERSPVPVGSPIGEPTEVGVEPTREPTGDAVTVTPIEIERSDGVRGGVLRLVTQVDIVHQDVHFEASPALSTWGPGIAYSRLLRFDAGANVGLPSLDIVCDVCSSWRMLDPVTFEFELREGIRWHDDALVGGRTLNAADVLFSLARQLGGPNGGLLGSIDGLSASGDLTLTVTLAEPDADFMLGLADARSKIVAREAVELTGDLREGPTVGTGPWRLTSTGSEVVHSFERFSNYFEADLPYADALRVHVVEDPQTRDAAFVVGQLDVMELTPFEWEALRVRLDDPVSRMVREAGAGLEFALNPGEPPFDDVNVRRAAFAAMDPARAIDEIWLGAGYLSFGFPLTGPDWGLGAPDLDGRLSDPAEARRLLSGLTLEPVTIRVGRFGQAYLDYAARIAEELRAVGFETTVEEVTRVKFADDVWKGGEYQAFVGPIPPVTSPNAFLFTVVHSAGPYYRGGPADAELDLLIERQGGEYDPNVRRARQKEIQRRMLDSAVRYMPVTRVSVWALQPWVRNFYPNLAGLDYAYWASVWLDGP